MYMYNKYVIFITIDIYAGINAFNVCWWGHMTIILQPSEILP